jgi:hypothetical protein
MKKTYLENIY